MTQTWKILKLHEIWLALKAEEQIKLRVALDFRAWRDYLKGLLLILVKLFLKGFS